MGSPNTYISIHKFQFYVELSALTVRKTRSQDFSGIKGVNLMGGRNKSKRFNQSDLLCMNY
jgi:hypothetical protein